MPTSDSTQRCWQLRNPTVDVGRIRCRAVEGWCSTPSVEAGETLELYVSADPPSPVLAEVFRSGYEDGAGGRFVAEFGPFEAVPQPLPPIGERRVRHCSWSSSLTFTVPPQWQSGVYLIRLTSLETTIDSYAVFVVRDDRPADLLVQTSDFTWQAYNKWPSSHSLYDDGGPKQWYSGPEVAISLDRPYGRYHQIVDAPLSTGSGEWLLWEYPMAFWLESEGYDVSYVSNLDVHLGRADLERAPAFLSVGHDEYYTRRMYDGLLAAVDRGTSIGFFGANICSAMIELSSAPDQRCNRVMRRVDRFGGPRPVDDARFPETQTFPGQLPPENTLIGGQTGDPATGRGDWVCTKPDHWIYADTGMAGGDAVPGLVGWEYHGDPAPIASLEVVSEGPTHHPRGEGHYATTVYSGAKGNTVFNAGTIWWADALSDPPGYVRPSDYTSLAGPDRRIQQITRNVINRLIETSTRHA